MNRFWTKKMLALMISVSLMAGSALPVFAAEQGADAEEGKQAGYETAEAVDAAGEQEPAAGADIISDDDAAPAEETIVNESAAPEEVTVYEETAAPEEITSTEARTEGEDGDGTDPGAGGEGTTPGTGGEGEGTEPEAPKDLAGATVTVNPASAVYDGKAKTPAVTVVCDGTTLVKDTDYTVAYSNNVNVGTATVTISGKDKYTGSKTATFAITACSIAGASVSGIASKLSYVFNGVKPVPTVTLGGVTLKSGTDYTVAYANNTKVGTATVTISGKGNYNGQIQKTFTIVKTSLKKLKINKIKAQVYTGKKIKPNPVITLNGVRLKKGRDYTLKYKNNKKHGKATVTIKGKGNFKGTVKKTFKIKKATIADAKITGLKNKTYTGSAITQKLKVKLAKKTLKSGRDYRVSYKSNVLAGKASVTVKGLGNYKGSRTLTFKIKKRSVKKASVSGLSEQGYTGKQVKPDITVRVSGRTLQKDRDYTLTFANNINIGTASVTIKGKGNYKGSVTKTFEIKRQTLDKAKVTVDDVTYTGYDQMPAVTVKLNDKTLKAATDYTVRYSNNVAIGTASVTVTGTGIYAGHQTKTFKILPPKTKLTSVQNSGAAIQVNWNAPDGDYLCELQCASDKAFNSLVFNLTVPGNMYRVENRSLSNTYVRIRTVKMVNGKAYNSAWTVWN